MYINICWLLRRKKHFQKTALFSERYGVVKTLHKTLGTWNCGTCNIYHCITFMAPGDKLVFITAVCRLPKQGRSRFQDLLEKSKLSWGTIGNLAMGSMTMHGLNSTQISSPKQTHTWVGWKFRYSHSRLQSHFWFWTQIPLKKNKKAAQQKLSFGPSLSFSFFSFFSFWKRHRVSPKTTTESIRPIQSMGLVYLPTVTIHLSQM